MEMYRIALANLRFPSSPEEAVRLVVEAVDKAGTAGAEIVCFPECYVPGYRLTNRKIPAPYAAYLTGAWAAVGKAAARAHVAVVLGTERLDGEALRIAAAVFGADGTLLGFQNKVQLDPSEDELFTPGCERHIFEAGRLKFGISICHEGWRYPETVRWAARRGAQVVFHPHFGEAGPGDHRPESFAENANSFHEKAILCRAAENTCYFASVNCASEGSPTTSAVARPDGTLLCWQPYGKEGLLVADLDLSEATGRLARRYRPLED